MPSGPAQQAHFPQLFTYGVTYFTSVPCATLTENALLEMADPTKSRLRPALRLGGVFGFIGGFLLAYQRSSCESMPCLCHDSRTDNRARH